MNNNQPKVGVGVIVDEEQVSVNCDLKEAKQIVAALRAAHPYEEPLIDIVPLINEVDL